jgi:hypothetical protein
LSSHTIISSSLSEEQRASSVGWKSKDFTIPLCPTKLNNNLPGYIYITKHKIKKTIYQSTNYKGRTNAEK